MAIIHLHNKPPPAYHNLYFWINHINELEYRCILIMDILLEYAGNDSFVSVQIVVNKGKTIYYSLDLCNKNDFLSVSPGV